MNQACEIRTFTADDIDDALQLCRQAGWNQLAADWSRLFRYQGDGCFVATVDGQLAGTVTTTRYDQQLAWIGMMLVNPKFRRCGIGTRLMSASIEYLTGSQTECIRLDATPVGQTVYEKIGFAPEWGFHRWERAANAAPPVRDVRSDQLSETHYALDRAAFGVDRKMWLQQLAADSMVHACQQGFGMLRSGHLADYLGPVVSSSVDAASEIIQSLLAGTSRRVFWDVPQPNVDAVAMARSLRFQPVRDLTRMVLGKPLFQPEIGLQYALSDPGTG